MHYVSMSLLSLCLIFFFFFSSRRRHTRYWRDWSSDVCSSDLGLSHRNMVQSHQMARNRLRKTRELHWFSSCYAPIPQPMLLNGFSLTGACSLSLRCGTDARFECLLSVIRQRANILRPSQAEQWRSVAYRKIHDVILTGLSLRAGVGGKSSDKFAYRR